MILCELNLISCHENWKQQEKEAGTNFILLSENAIA